MRRPLQPLLAGLALAARLALAQAAPPGEPAPPPPPPDDASPVYSETVDVALTTLVVRVEDRRNGKPLVGLGPSDFRLFVGDREIPLSAAEWVSTAAPVSPEEIAELEAAGVPPPPAGKLVVFFVQTDFHPVRISGQLRTLPEAKRFIEALDFVDPVAVVSYDSHLKLRLDFTLDREPVREALDQAIRTGPEPRLRRSSEPSLASHFDFDAARRAAKPERALELTARALEPLPGEKVVVYLGWGLGRYGSSGVTMPPEYGDALDALRRAHATVFVLDVTSADYHSLEVGLKSVAANTGGTYAKTYQNPRVAAKVLAEMVTGYYLLYFRPPEPGLAGRLRVELADPGRGDVLMAPTALR